MFDIKNKRKPNAKQQKIFIIGASIASLVASGSNPPTTPPETTEDGLITSGDVTGIATSNDDIISTGDAGGIISSGAGMDLITGGAAVDIIWAGAGADHVNGGAGKDNLLVIGITVGADYAIENLQNVAGADFDLSALLTLDEINNHSVSDLVAGESIDGEEDGAILYTFGIVDFTGVTLNNITEIYLDNSLTISNETLQTLISQGLADIHGEGIIIAETGLLDLDGVNVPATITIMDADGNIILPTFTSDNIVNMAENSTIVGTFAVTDASSVGQVSYGLSGTDAALFNINTSTGEVEFKSAPDFETITGAFNIVITATDQHEKSTDQDITINITNVNEAVSFAAENLQINVAENQTAVTIVSATDIDGDSLTYSLSGADAELFAINATSGEVSFKSAPNFETVSAPYNIVVTASDGTFSDTQNIEINVTNINETMNFDASDLTINAAENQTAVATVSATDIDGDILTYGLTGDDADLFDINTSTGQITFNSAPDFEAISAAFNVVVTASDGALSATKNVKIIVTNVNEALSFSEGILAVNVAENQTTVPTITAIDIDGDTLTYGLTGDDEDLFNINSSTGEITYKSAPNFETSSNPYNVVVTASDGKLSATKTVEISVTNVNEAPEFTTSALQIEVAENQFFVAIITATDAENDTITYSLTGDDAHLFKINPITGEINLNIPEDFEHPTHSNQQYSVIVNATDDQLSTNQNVEITVTDVGVATDPAAPILSLPFIQKHGAETLVNTLTSDTQQDSSVASLANGGYVVVWETLNKDDDNTYEYNIHAQRYDDLGNALDDEFLVSSITDHSQQRPKIIGLNDGGFVVVWQTYIDTTGPEPFEIYGRKFDVNGVAADVDFQINVGDYFVSTPSLASLADGGFVVTWNSYLQDGDDTGVIGRIYNADGTAQTDDIQINTFIVDDQTSGQITTLADGGFIVAWTSWLQDTSSLGSYFQKFDSDGVPDGDETLINFTTEHYQGYVSIAALNNGGFVASWTDNSASGSDIGTHDIKGNVYAADGTLVLSEFSVNQYTDKSQQISSIAVLNDGSFIIAWQSNGQDGSNYGIYARHFKADGTALTDEFLINSATNGTQEDLAITALNSGGFVATWSSNDGSDKGIYSQIFTGDIYRFEANQDYNFNILAALPDGQTGFTLGNVTISNIADGMSFTDENGDAVGTLVDDTLSLTSAQLAGLKIKLDNSFNTDVDLTISVTSKNAEGIHTKTNLIIEVDMVYAPEFNNDDVETINVDEHTINVGTFAATDAESQTLTYSLTGVDAHLFSINSATGEVAFIVAEDHENPTRSNNQYNVAVVATDTEGLIGTKTLIVDIVNLDEFQPQFASDDVYKISMPDNRTGVASILATDADGDDISYSLTGGADVGLFSINSTSGKIDFDNLPVFANNAADNTFNVTVTASANGQIDTRDVEIHLTDYNTPILYVANEITRSNSEILVSNSADYDQSGVAITTLSDGSILLTWAEDNEIGKSNINGQKYTIEGDKLGDEFLITTNSSYIQNKPAVTALDNGAFVVVWSSNGQVTGYSQDDVFGQMFDSLGDATGDEFAINSPAKYVSWNQDNAKVASLSNGGFVVIWDGRESQGKGVMGQVYDANGTPIGSEFDVNASRVGKQEAPDVAGLSNGGFVVIWQSDRGQDGDDTGLFGQKYESIIVGGEETFQTDGAAFQVNSYTTGNQDNASVTTLADGGFVVVWQSNGQDGSEYGIYGQRYNADGLKTYDNGAETYAEFSINTETNLRQQKAEVTALDDGGFVVVWQSEGQDDTEQNNGVYGQRFDAIGTPVDQEFQINSTTSGDQQLPAITSTQGGGIMVAWAGIDPSGNSNNIYAQIFEAAPIFKLEKNTTTDFDIISLVQPDQDDILSDVTILSVPTYLSFTKGDDGSGEDWTMSQTDLDGLRITTGDNQTGAVQLTLNVSSLDAGDNSINATTTYKVLFSIGETPIGADENNNSFDLQTANTWHVDGLGGTDNVEIYDSEANAYSYEISGNDLLISYTDHTYLLHSVEQLEQDGAFTNVADLHTELGIDQAAYNIWLAHSYDYNF